jgi:hypothetical protein
MTDVEKILRGLGERVYTARLANGARLNDATDFHAWLLEIAEKAASAESADALLAQI